MACVVCANEGNEEKSEVKVANGEIDVECGFLDSLNNQRNDKQMTELNREIDQTSSAAASLRDNEPPYRGVVNDLIINENQERNKFIPAAANDEVDKGIVQQVNSSHSVGEDNLHTEDKEDGYFDDKVVEDTSFFEPVVEQMLEEKPEVIKTSEIEEKPGHTLKIMDEEKPSLSLNKVTLLDDTTADKISERVAEGTKEDCASKTSDSIDHDSEHEYETAACVEQEKPAVKSKEITPRVTRARAHSEQRSGTDNQFASQDISSALRSGSLESMKFYRQQEDITKGSRPSRLTYSPPTNARSPHLRREKKPARMLRHTSFDGVCNVLNFRTVTLLCHTASSLIAVFDL